MVARQGSARIEVQPADQTVFGGRRVYLDWARAKDSGKTKEEVLADEPHTFPPLEKRGCTLMTWGGSSAYYGGARGALRQFLSQQHKLGAKALSMRLQGIRAHLWRPDLREKSLVPPNHCTAVSSDGQLVDGAAEPELLVEFVSFLDSALVEHRYRMAQEEIMRALGCCSAASPNLLSLLRSALKHPAGIKQPHLVAIGNCLREPEDLRLFVEATDMCIEEGWLPVRNEWLKALARILQYRDDASQDVDSDECRRITEYCLEVMTEQIDNGRAAHLYRNASLCIVYLLGRRHYDPNYLGPDERTTSRTKEVCRRAIRGYKLGHRPPAHENRLPEQPCVLMVDPADVSVACRVETGWRSPGKLDGSRQLTQQTAREKRPGAVLLVRESHQCPGRMSTDARIGILECPSQGGNGLLRRLVA